MDDGYFMANCSGCGEWYHNKSWTFKLKIFEIKITTYNRNALFAENKLNENEIRGLSVEDLCGEIRHFQKLGCGNIFLAQSQKLCP